MNLKMALDITSFIVVVVLGVYQIYKSTKRFLEHKKNREEFLSINKETLKEEFLDHKLWVAIYALVSVGMLVAGVYFFIKGNDYLYSCACLAMTLIMAGFVLDCFVTRRSWYYEEGFYFENRFYRYRSVAANERRKGIFPANTIRFHGQPDIVVTVAMAAKVSEHEGAWKKERKEKKKQGR